jgi:tRNA pseudouridine38-40 synthase
VIAYDGANYQGFQRQATGVPSVQATVEQALAAVIGQPIRVLGAARTDTGVHASGQVISFDLAEGQWQHDESTLLRALNAELPDDVAVQRLERAPDGFHPRFDATSRTYCYRVYQAGQRHPLYARTALHVYGSLNLAAMNEVAATLIGEHDFATFGAPTQGESTVRRVFRSEWMAEAAGEAARLLTYRIEANGFLQRMVRALVGEMVDIGLGKRTLAEFMDAFQAADRSRARAMAPPHGLTLIKVSYRTEKER